MKCWYSVTQSFLATFYDMRALPCLLSSNLRKHLLVIPNIAQPTKQSPTSNFHFHKMEHKVFREYISVSIYQRYQKSGSCMRNKYLSCTICYKLYLVNRESFGSMCVTYETGSIIYFKLIVT